MTSYFVLPHCSPIRMEKSLFCIVLLFSLNTIETKLLIKPFNRPQILNEFEKVFFNLVNLKKVCIWTNTNLHMAFIHLLKFHQIAVLLTNYNSLSISSNVCVNNVVFNNEFNTTESFFYDRPPRFHNIFFIINTENSFSLTDTYSDDVLMVFGIAKVILVWKNDKFKMSSPFFPPRRLVPVTYSSMLHDDIPVNVKGRKVNVATFNCSLFSIMNESKSLDAHDGVEMRMLKELAFRVNFTPSFVKETGIGKWGLMLPNGSWVGGVAGALERGLADLGFCNIWNVLRYVKSFDYGPQWNAVYHTYMVPRPRMVNGFWIIIVQLFERSVWFLLLATFLLITFLYWKFKNSHYNDHEVAIESVLTVCGFFIAASSHLPKSTVRFVRHVITSWSVFGFFICSLFCNTIITRLMIPHLSPLIDNVEDIVNHNYLWGEPGYTNESKRSIYFNLEDPWQVILEGRYRNLTSNTSRAALHSGRFVFPVQRLGQEYIFINIDGLKIRDLSGFRVMRQDLNQFYSSFGFSRHSPMLEVCHKPLRRFIETGLTEHWRKSVILHHGKPPVKLLLSEPSTQGVDSFKPLTVSSNLAAFRILISGWVLASVVFVSELIIKYRFLCLNRKTKKEVFHLQYYD